MPDLEVIRRERADRIEQLRLARERARTENRARMPETAAIIDAFTAAFGPVTVAWAIEGDQTAGNPPQEEIERHRQRREAARAVREVRNDHVGDQQQTVRCARDTPPSPVRPVRPPIFNARAPRKSEASSKDTQGRTQARARKAPAPQPRGIFE
jgi:hypothetical protein